MNSASRVAAALNEFKGSGFSDRDSEWLVEFLDDYFENSDCDKGNC